MAEKSKEKVNYESLYITEKLMRIEMEMLNLKNRFASLVGEQQDAMEKLTEVDPKKAEELKKNMIPVPNETPQ